MEGISELTHTVTITSTVQQLCKKQDFTGQGEGIDSETGETFKWAILNDGHGSDACINIIRSIPNAKLAQLIGSPFPVQALAQYIDDSHKIFKWESSGATVVIVKVYQNRAVCLSSGDSQVTAFKDGVMIYQSTEHNGFNPEEVKRVEEMGFRIIKSSNIRIVAPTMIEPCSSFYMVFPGEDNYGRRLACTQALGHNSMTGYCPEVKTIAFEPGCSYRFVLGSDGLYDMIVQGLEEDMTDLSSKSSAELCSKAADRWRQEWDARMSMVGPIQKIQFESNGWDDVSVVVIEARAN